MTLIRLCLESTSCVFSVIFRNCPVEAIWQLIYPIGQSELTGEGGGEPSHLIYQYTIYLLCSGHR